MWCVLAHQRAPRNGGSLPMPFVLCAGATTPLWLLGRAISMVAPWVDGSSALVLPLQVAVSQGNAQVAIAFQFLHELVKVLKNYFGTFDEDAIRNNFVLIYELLDEVLDYGYPQNCSTDVLKMYITQEGTRSAAADKAAQQAVTIQATGAISWRKEGIKYRKNELFIDVVENCNLMMSSKGTILRNDVSGAILVKCYLSGTPECKFGLNDKLLLDNEAKASAVPSLSWTG